MCEGKQGCVRTLPCFDEVVVTDMASCPPPVIMYGQLASGDKHAELRGLSESKHLSRFSVLASKRRTCEGRRGGVRGRRGGERGRGGEGRGGEVRGGDGTGGEGV